MGVSYTRMFRENLILPEFYKKNFHFTIFVIFGKTLFIRDLIKIFEFKIILIVIY